MAEVLFNHGVMGCGKSLLAIKDAYDYRKNGINVEVLKHSADTRFASDKIVSRLGNNTLSVEVMPLADFNKYIPKPDTQIVIIDEAQFYKYQDLLKLYSIAHKNTIKLIFYGLMRDSNGDLFTGSEALIRMGATLKEMIYPCQISGCGCNATHHLLYSSDHKLIRENKQIVIGDHKPKNSVLNTNTKNPYYKSVCFDHFIKSYYGQKIK